MIPIRDLAVHGFVRVEYPKALRSLTDEAMVAWKAFCELPDEQKARFDYSGDIKASGNGYELKRGTAHDFKENFHLRASWRDWLLEQAHRVDDTVAPRFIETGIALNDGMVGLLRTFSEAVEQEYGVTGLARDVMDAQPDWLIRFLHYFGDLEPGAVMAAPHNDKGPFTIHLDESGPGVQKLDWDKRTWSDLDLAHGETIIFPGNGLQNRSRCAVRAISHRVMATELTAREGRYASVAFITPRNTRFFNKAALGSQQDLEPGWSYDLSFEEFDRYFTD